MPGKSEAHYERLAERYDENWEHSPEFIAWMTRQIVERLRPEQGDRVADVGCGTGLFARGLAERAGRVVCIDPSAKMLEQVPAGLPHTSITASAEDVAAGRVQLPVDRFDAILVKEAIHHVRDRGAVLRGLGGLLAPGGRILIVMLPTTIEYPLFSDALHLFEELQPDPARISDGLERARLTVHLTYESFPLSFAREHYLQMVHNRYMSLLSEFDDAELGRGIEEIKKQHPGERLEFHDRFAFVLGRRA
ncbi:class I SAM-dependent methyltransferase [Actinomadura welshii]|uniref:class I SAM-dependent methyltransferase n=1 Tax=Actinomadura welshii TaxID=3103817 RepID=UPI0003AD647F|nr:class I SAM-dependent methyltransferase [Actinomadura madurae]